MKKTQIYLLAAGLSAALAGCSGGSSTLRPAAPGAEQYRDGYGGVCVSVYVPPALTATVAEGREVPSTTTAIRIRLNRPGTSEQARMLAMSEIVSGRGSAKFTTAAGGGYSVVVEARNRRDAVVASAQQSDVSVPEASQTAIQLRLRTPSTPVVTVTATPSMVSINQTITLQASATGAVEEVREYHWDYGDGRTAVGFPPLTVAYPSEGQRVITCRVLDGAGQTASSSTTVTVQGFTPLLVVSPVELDLGSGQTTGRFQVSNQGTGTLPWTATVDAASWLRLTGATSGVDAGSVPVSVSRGSLTPRPEPYRGTVRFEQSDGQHQRVDAVVIVYTPKLAATTNTLDFGLADATRTLTVFNSGSGDLGTWTAQSNAAWLTVAPESGQQDDTVSVQANRTGLSSGQHQANLTFFSAFGSATVVATCQVAAAALQVSPATLDFGASQTLKSVNVTASSGSLNWEATTNQSWLTVTSAGHTPASAVVQVNRTGLPAGVLQGTVTFVAGSSTAQVEVRATANASTGDVGLVIN